MTSGAQPAARVTLRPMTEAEFGEWRDHSIESFAEDLARARGRPIEAARVRATAQFEELLADGVATAGTWLFVVLDDAGDSVGTLWLGVHPERRDVAFVYDLEINESARRRGYGRATMLAAEQVVRDAGMSEVGLNVFGFNEAARALYESIGYGVVATQMAKKLDAPA
jgi:ribosomal protein S18 acetylase RimI-like enzyme